MIFTLLTLHCSQWTPEYIILLQRYFSTHVTFRSFVHFLEMLTQFLIAIVIRMGLLCFRVKTIFAYYPTASSTLNDQTSVGIFCKLKEPTAPLAIAIAQWMVVILVRRWLFVKSVYFFEHITLRFIELPFLIHRVVAVVKRTQKLFETRNFVLDVNSETNCAEIMLTFG